MAATIHLLGAADAAVLDRVADDVFDDAIRPGALREFLARPDHHLAVAVEAGVVVGFASAVDYVHPDKPRELWINEVGVAGPYRQRGLAKALLQALFAKARALQCAEAWVLTERGNGAALGLYRSLGGEQMPDDTVGFTICL
ncbi:MAG: GNAT family N-acetyltransferase [Alphaproteobacteria bacterium]|nr:GNAT family N-acetyltransferase [Alphaproteobacteria bacterium]